MATKKRVIKKSPVAKKRVVKANPKPKSIRSYSREEMVSLRRPKVQTAEGWKRDQLRARQSRREE